MASQPLSVKTMSQINQINELLIIYLWVCGTELKILEDNNKGFSHVMAGSRTPVGL